MKLREQAEATCNQISSIINASPYESAKKGDGGRNRKNVIDATVEATGECTSLAMDYSKSDDDTTDEIAKCVTSTSLGHIEGFS